MKSNLRVRLGAGAFHQEATMSQVRDRSPVIPLLLFISLVMGLLLPSPAGRPGGVRSRPWLRRRDPGDVRQIFQLGESLAALRQAAHARGRRALRRSAIAL